MGGWTWALAALGVTARSHRPVNGSAFWAEAGVRAAAASRQTRLNGFMSALVYRNRRPGRPSPSGFRFRPHHHHRIGIRGMVDHAQVVLLDEVLVQGVVQNVQGTTGGERAGTLDRCVRSAW